MDRGVEPEAWTADSGKYSGEIVGKGKKRTLLLLLESQLRLAKENLRRIKNA